MSFLRARIILLFTAAVVSTVFTAASALAVTVNATVTGDNHYAIFWGNEDGSVMNFVGRNEFGAVGNPTGTYNWSHPENYVFDVPDGQYIYVVGWSDDSVAQAWLGQFVMSTGTMYSDLSWEYSLSFVDLDDADPAPTASALGTYVSTAVWNPVTTSRDHGAAPWFGIPGISPDADWIWGSAMEPGSAYGEAQVFRHQVPEPASVLLFGSALLGLAGVRRRARG